MKSTTCFLLYSLLAITPTVVLSSCPPEFHGKCLCGKANYNYKEMFVVNCTNSNLNHPTILRRLPNETQVLIFTGNNLGSFPWSIFEKFNEYPVLEIVDLTNNNIQGIRGKFAHDVLYVKTLILNHNQIGGLVEEEEQRHPLTFSNFINLESLHLTNAFAETSDSPKDQTVLEATFLNTHLSKLTKLHMEQNEIAEFQDKNLFCNLPLLMDLHIADNNISEIDLNLQCLNHLRFLDLRDNGIQRLPNSTLTYLDRIKLRQGSFFVDLSGNPFQCDCHIADFLNWAETKRDSMLKDWNSYMCNDGLPSSNVHKYLRDVHHVQCLASAKSNQGVYLGIFSLLLVSVIVLFMCLNFVLCRRRHPTLDQLFNRIQYSSISSTQEEPVAHV